MNSSFPSWRPTAAIADLKQRARIVQRLRNEFETAGYWEVATPVLSRETIIDAHITPLTLNDTSAPGKRFLQTSPEAHMKRLLTMGADRIFQFSHVFRQREQGARHNTEFTLLEWYAREENHYAQMDFAERLIRAVAEISPACSPLAAQPFERLAYDEAFRRYLGTSVLGMAGSELRELAEREQISIPPGLEDADRDGWFNLLLAEKVEPELGKGHPQFLIDYPASQAALACIRYDRPPVAERFELYIEGIEICNGYHEETDAEELTRRFQLQNEIRQQEGESPLPLPELFLESTCAGYPPSAGVALGLERLLMWCMKKATLPEVVAFPYDRA